MSDKNDIKFLLLDALVDGQPVDVAKLREAGYDLADGNVMKFSFREDIKNLDVHEKVDGTEPAWRPGDVVLLTEDRRILFFRLSVYEPEDFTQDDIMPCLVPSGLPETYFWKRVRPDADVATPLMGYPKEGDPEDVYLEGFFPFTPQTTIGSGFLLINELLADVFGKDRPKPFPATPWALSGQLPLERLCRGYSDHAGLGMAPAAEVRRTTGQLSMEKVSGSLGGYGGTLTVLRDRSMVAQASAPEGASLEGVYGVLNVGPCSRNALGPRFDMQVAGVTLSANGLHSLSAEYALGGRTYATSEQAVALGPDRRPSAAEVQFSVSGPYAYSSGVAHMSPASNLSLTQLTLSGVTDHTFRYDYRVGRVGCVYAGTRHLTFADMGVGGAPDANLQTLSAQGPVGIAPSPSLAYAGTDVPVFTPVGVGGDGPSVAHGRTMLVMAGNYAGIREEGLPNALSGSPATPRVSSGRRADTPTWNVPPAWDPTLQLPDFEASVVGGVLSHDVTDYSAYTPASYSMATEGRSGSQYATFAFRLPSTSKFTVDIKGRVSGFWVLLPGDPAKGDTTTSGLSATNGWRDLCQQYDGKGPGCCQVGYLEKGREVDASYICTFGKDSSSDSLRNYIVVRLRLDAGDRVTRLSFKQ